MRKYEFILEENLFGGLRKNDEDVEESPAVLTECFNVAPTKDTPKLHEALISLDATSITWKS